MDPERNKSHSKRRHPSRSRSYSRKHKKRDGSRDKDRERHRRSRDVKSQSRHSSNSNDDYDHHHRHKKSSKHKKKDRSKSRDRHQKRSSEDRDRKHKSKKKKHSRSKSRDDSKKKKKHKHRDRSRSKEDKHKKDKKQEKESIDILELGKKVSFDDNIGEEEAKKIEEAFFQEEEDEEKIMEERRRKREELLRQRTLEQQSKREEKQQEQQPQNIKSDIIDTPQQQQPQINNNNVSSKQIENPQSQQNGNAPSTNQPSSQPIIDEGAQDKKEAPSKIQEENIKITPSKAQTTNGDEGNATAEENKQNQPVEENSAVKKNENIEKEKFTRMIDNIREKMEKDAKEREDREREHKERQERKKAKKLEEKAKSQHFDMFAETPEDPKHDNLVPMVRNDQNEYKDDEGYYRVQIGEILNGKYQITEKLGKGVFGNVVKGINIEDPEKTEVALKIIKNEDIYIMSGLKEREVLTLLNETDKLNKRHIVRLLDSFDHKKHLILVFELMEMDLREVLKTIGKGVGISIEGTRSYARQLFIALFHLKKNNIIHADLKPDNILVTNSKKTLKLADLGSAFPIEENTITPYLISRYYRPPEIILGLPYECAVDVWSAACTIYELYTGKFLFPGRSNNEMLKLIMQTKGRFSNKVLKRGEYTAKYFDKQYNFLSQEIDPVTKQEYFKPIPMGNKITRDLATLLKTEVELSDEDKKKEQQLKDFLEKCLTLDPNKRLTPEEALKHPFINYDINKFAVDSKQYKHVF